MPDAHIYGEINSKTDLHKVFTETRATSSSTEAGRDLPQRYRSALQSVR